MKISTEFGQSQLVIRPAEDADVPTISELAKRTWADAFGYSVSPQDLKAELEMTRSIDYFRSAMTRDTILVAEAGHNLVGYVQFGDVDIPEVERRPGDRSLHRVYVETELHGQGIGRELMNAALGHPRLRDGQRVFLQVWDKNERAIRLYESLGFRTVGTARFTIGTGEAAEDLVMVLDKSASASVAE